MFNNKAGTSLAQVIKLDGPNVTLQIFAGARGVDTAARVRFLGESMKVPFSDDLLGRAFTGACTPRDGGPVIQGDPSPIGQPSVNPSKRIMPYRMVRTNIPMIDLFNTLVVSQKLPIFAKAGEPYNELLARIALQADSDVIVIGGMGLKHDEYLKLRNITVGYRLPLSKEYDFSVRIYVTGQNLLTITPYKGYDPEVSSGTDSGAYPSARTILFGTNISF